MDRSAIRTARRYEASIDRVGLALTPSRRTQRSPFRSETDLSLLSSFAQHYALLTGRAVVAESERAYVNISNSDLEWQLRKVLEREQDSICLADHHDHALDQERLDATLTAFMAAYVPVAAPWEDDLRAR